MELNNEFIEATKLQYGYKNINKNLIIGHKNLGRFLSSKYSCSDNIEALENADIDDMGIVTGFGPTNSPTAGTLSVIFRAIAMQRETNIFTNIIISDLGAWNSRNLNWNQMNEITEKFIKFISKRGFDHTNGCIRTHKDKNNLVLSGIISKMLSEEDFRSNREATDILYDKLKLRGNFFNIMIDGLYTITDILNPLYYNKKHVLVLCGIEEHYFSTLAKLVLKRFIETYGNQFFHKEQTISALFTKLIGGLYPYPKMSKSIPDSAINLTDTDDMIRNKILKCDPINDKIVLQMIQLVSDWSAREILEAEEALKLKNQTSWQNIKLKYTDYFIDIANQWKTI